MRYAIATETHPPEVNGAALTVESLEHGLHARGHKVSLIRQRQCDREPDGGLPVPGMALPRYHGLRFGLPVTGRLLRHWRTNRPDALCIATEGPLGRAAQRAAANLEIPVLTGLQLHARFDEYGHAYGLGALRSTTLRWMRRVHNRSAATPVPAHGLMRFLQTSGSRHVRHLPRDIDPDAFSPRHRDAFILAATGLAMGDRKRNAMARAASDALRALRPECAVACFNALLSEMAGRIGDACLTA